jgi:hypothetical protein
MSTANAIIVGKPVARMRSRHRERRPLARGGGHVVLTSGRA